MKKHLLAALFAAAATCVPALSGVRASGVAIVPKPLYVVEEKGSFRPGDRCAIVIGDESLRRPAEIFAEFVEPSLGCRFEIGDRPVKRSITLVLNPGTLDDEEYTLVAGRHGVDITGGSPKAVLYGLQTLRQLLAGGEVPAVTIRDKPTFAYRGAMLDVCRHFFPVEDVKCFIDILSLHKINTFHWHLTDDQGWRIEIRKYPRLTEVGSVRSKTLVGHGATSNEYDGKAYGGYYTQEQIREVVAYAAERYIEVIPEIEMPGHGYAALASYPRLGCAGGPYEVWPRWGVSEGVYCAGKDSTYDFMEGVLAEVVELFPSKYIHIGGDECPKGPWKACAACQKRMCDENLKDEHELQSYFVRRIEQIVRRHGRSIIGWDEILEGGVSKTATIMSWRGAKGGITAARQGNHVIMAPNTNCYLDYFQTSDPGKYEPFGIGGYLPVRQVYRLEPYDQLTPAQQSYILGVQANLWTEYIGDLGHVQHMILPRLAAVAETGWAYDRKEYGDFVKRMESLRKVYEQAGYRYAPYLFEGVE